MRRWFLPILAYLTLIHNAIVITSLIAASATFSTPGMKSYVWEVEVSGWSSPGTIFLIGMVTWTSILAIGCLLKTRRRPETHCRKCDYILRGLREPRCPECGESI